MIRRSLMCAAIALALGAALAVSLVNNELTDYRALAPGGDFEGALNRVPVAVASESRIRDVDMAAEMVNFARAGILQVDTPM
jgi:hypothetical protein